MEDKTICIVHRPKETKKEDLLYFYDLVNEICKGKDLDVFYTHEEVEELKKDPTNIFL